MTEMANYVYESYMKKVTEMKEQYKEMYQPPPEEQPQDEPSSEDEEENPYEADERRMDVDPEQGPSKPEPVPVVKRIVPNKQQEKFVPSLIENEIEDMDTSNLEKPGKGKGKKKQKKDEEEEDEEMEEQE